MAAKTIATNYASGPDAESTTGWSYYNIADDAEHAAWYEAWRVYLEANPAKRVGDAPMLGREAATVRRGGGPGEGPGKPPQTRLAEVKEWLNAYEGRFQFLLDMKAIAQGRSKYDRFTPGQYEALVRMMDKEIAAKAAKPSLEAEGIRDDNGIRFDNLPYGTFKFAVMNDSGNLTFIRIDRPAEFDRFKQRSKWFNWTFVKHLVGPTENKLGSARPGQQYIGQFENLIKRILDDPMAAMKLYGQEIGECGDCGRRLTNEESRKIGIGPICEAKGAFK